MFFTFHVVPDVSDMSEVKKMRQSGAADAPERMHKKNRTGRQMVGCFVLERHNKTILDHTGYQ